MYVIYFQMDQQKEKIWYDVTVGEPRLSYTGIHWSI